jgi:hypothetical protein
MGVLHQRGFGLGPVGSAGYIETVQACERAGWGDFEDRAPVVGPASRGCSVEVSIGTLYQPSVRRLAVIDVEAVQAGKVATKRDFKDRAAAS